MHILLDNPSLPLITEKEPSRCSTLRKPFYRSQEHSRSLPKSIAFPQKSSASPFPQLNLQTYFYPSNWQIKWRWSAHLLLCAEGEREQKTGAHTSMCHRARTVQRAPSGATAPPARSRPETHPKPHTPNWAGLNATIHCKPRGSRSVSCFP